MNIPTEAKNTCRTAALLVAVSLIGFMGVSMAADRVALVIGSADYKNLPDYPRI